LGTQKTLSGTEDSPSALQRDIDFCMSSRTFHSAFASSCADGSLQICQQAAVLSLVQGGPSLLNLQAHPTEDLPKPQDPDPPAYWAFQNTWVDMQSFSPVLEESLQLADIPRRPT